MAEVPASPAVTVAWPELVTVAASDPVSPPAPITVVERTGSDGTTPFVTVVALGILSPTVSDSVIE